MERDVVRYGIMLISLKSYEDITRDEIGRRIIFSIPL